MLACETETRAWVVSRDTGRKGALALAERLAGAVRAAEPWLGAPMTVSIGVAVLGEDGHDSSSLIAAAEEARFAASAAGVDVAQADRGERDPDPPERPGPKLVG